jgi:hypothetical protein
MIEEQWGQPTGSRGLYASPERDVMVDRPLSAGRGSTSGLPNVPPTVVTRGSSEIDPTSRTAMAGAIKNSPASCSGSNSSCPVTAIGNEMSAIPTTRIPTPMRRIERFIQRPQGGSAAVNES